MLILKLLYLIFTTEGLYEFFYTNDLCVLVDIVLRELCDLGDESDAEAVSEHAKFLKSYIMHARSDHIWATSFAKHIFEY
jgi:hypothetical protein